MKINESYINNNNNINNNNINENNNDSQYSSETEYYFECDKKTNIGIKNGEMGVILLDYLIIIQQMDGHILSFDSEIFRGQFINNQAFGKMMHKLELVMK